MSRILLINPDYYHDIYSKSKVRAAISRGIPPLGLLCVASPLLSAGHEVKVLNLNLLHNPNMYLYTELNEFNPDFVGITSTTPLIKKAYQLATTIKKHNNEIIIVAGGPHPSALPEDVLRESEIDCVVTGEGEFALKMIVEKGLSPFVPNICYKQDETIIKSRVKGYVTEDLDTLPYPAYELLEVKKYSQPGISSRRQPVGYLETSRGCYARCTYCNKNIHGYKVRQKSPMRVVDEMERMLRIGFQEIHLIDDIFTANKRRVYTICEEILRRKLRFLWYPRGGLRVNDVNLELLKMMKKAGCYRIPFGIESGSQRIIDVINKKTTLEQAERAVKSAKGAGLETECYFMIGLPTETEEDIQKSIDFAIKLDPDYVKFAITIPLPGTVMFDQMLANGQLKTRDWGKYTFSTSAKELYDHDILSGDVIDRYLDISYRKYYFRPGYILRMIYKTALNGTIFKHAKALFKTRWWKHD